MRKDLPPRRSADSDNPPSNNPEKPGPDRRRTVQMLGAGAVTLAGATAMPSGLLAQGSGGRYQLVVEKFEIVPRNPKPGQRALLKMRIRAKGRGARHVPWEIKVGTGGPATKVIGRGTQRGVVGGRHFDVTARWTATPGLHNFLGSADPRNTFREQGRERYDNAKGFSVRVQAASASNNRQGPSTGRNNVQRPGQQPSGQRQIGQRTTGRSGQPQTSSQPFTVKADNVTLNRPAPAKGDSVIVRFRIRTFGDGTKDVPWRILRPGMPALSGTERNVRGGRTFQVTANFTARAGEFSYGGTVDPNNTLGESASARGDNSISKTLFVADWQVWGVAAFAGAVNGVRTWQTKSRLTGIKVMAVSAVGPPGVLKGSTTSIKSEIRNAMKAAGCPHEIADRFGEAVRKAWQDWRDKVTVPGLPWYPAFAAFPGPQAPPMPNVPTPLASLPSSKAAGLSPNALATSIRVKLGNTIASQPGAQDAINAFANQFGARFALWLGTQQVMRVLGKGPVPTFAPPYVPVGPVVGGSAQSAAGVLASKPF